MAWIWTILCLLFIFICSVYWYKKKSKSYLEELGIPYIKSGRFDLISFVIKSRFVDISIHELELEKYKTRGRIYGTSENGIPTISIADLDLLRKILVKDFHVFSGRRSFESGDPIADSFLTVIRGEQWKRIRTIITPAFSTGKIKRMTDIIINSSKTLTQNFLSQDGRPIDGKKLFNTFTMDVIASTAFGTKIHSYQDPNNKFVQEASKFFNVKISFKLIFVACFPNLARSLGISFFDQQMVKFFTDVTLEIVEDRKKNGTVKNDFLQLLIDAEKEYEKKEQEKEGNTILESTEKGSEDATAKELGHEEGNENIFKYSKKYKSLSQNELLAQCLIFFLAGFDTTASTLTCVAYVLAVNPDIQEKLRKEVDAAIYRHNSQLTYEAIQEMKYLDCVISETLRMYPPAFRIERLADEDYELEGTGVTIKKGTVVTVPLYAIQKDPEYYPEPEAFKPERFTADEKGLRHPYSYLTFGAGPRNCVGMRFALMEIKLCIAYVLSQVIIKKCPQTKVPMKLTSPIGLIKPDVTFTVEKRKNAILNDNL